MTFGPRLLEENRAEFRIWAPAMKQLALLIDDRAPLPMQAKAGGWFEAVADCAAGTRYRFRLPDGTVVPDPASRFQPDDVLGPSQLCASGDYAWRHSDWRGRPWEETVIYELHVGLCGGYRGVQERLPELRGLGVTAIEFMPLADFPGRRNWGYDGVLPYAADAAYGTPAQLKELVDHAHGLGLMVFLDVVYNHFGPEGNFLHAYAPQFFREDRHTPWGAAIDFRRPEVRQFFIRNALYWLEEFRFDGLRFDAVHAIDDAGFLRELAASVRTATRGRHVHLMLENERNDAQLLREGFDAQWNDDAHNALHVLLTGEDESYYANYKERPAALLARCLAEGFAYQGEISPTHGKPRGSPSADLPATSFIFFLQNHDQTGNRALGERLTTLAHPEALRAAVALQLLCPHVPLLFMGEEYASRAPFLFFTDFHDTLAEQVREGRRKEFASFKAFADPQRRAQIPDPNAAQTFERSRPEPASRTTFGEYRHLLELRRERLVPRLRGTASLGARVIADKTLEARWRLGDGAELRLVANFGKDETSCEPVRLPLLHATTAAAADALAQGRVPAHACGAFLREAP